MERAKQIELEGVSSDVDEHGLDIKKIRAVEVMLIKKREKLKLTDEEKKLRKELQAARACF